MKTEGIVTSMWSDPKLIIPAISVLIASVIVPVLIHWLKGKREYNQKLLDIRTKAYTEYFKRYEEAAKSVGNDYEEFSNVTLKNEFLKLLESDASNEAIIKFQEAVGEFPNKIQSAHRKATEEITTLKIIGSNTLLVLVTEFEELNQEILELTSKWLHEMQASLTQPDFEAPIAKELTIKGKNAKALKENIIMQMRKELNLE
ncbi:MAG: hypothetical protein GXP14_01940 [Gammaproteobacteria bacterium]|nr:hypothetical protein [Gammaproteobacteria bacterium]